MEEEKGRELANACCRGRWEEAKTIISRNPRLAYTKSASGHTLLYWAALCGNVDFLQHILDAILLLLLLQQTQKEKEQMMLRDVFEERDEWFAPVHISASNGDVQCLAILVEHAPNKAEMLEVKKWDGRTPGYFAAYYDHAEALDFIVRNAPSGVGVLEAKDIYARTPLDFATPNEHQVVDYINKIKHNMLPPLSSSFGKQRSIKGTTGYLQSTRRTIKGLQSNSLQSHP